jgi:Ca2+-binding EF-hand superfamily protein
LLDKNNDGFVTQDQIVELLVNHKIGNKNIVTQLLNKFDSNGDGQYTLDELCGLAHEIKQKTSKSSSLLFFQEKATASQCDSLKPAFKTAVETAFKIADKDKNGVITEA